MNHPRIFIAGTHSGVGKTTVTLALLAAFRARGREVQPFKVGPDYIDPGHHRLASGRVSRNLDGWMFSPELNQESFRLASKDAELSIIEGMMGLFDSCSPSTEIGSAAQMAKQLKAPVLLVIDGSAMARSAAAMVSGYTQFDRDLWVAGVIFNRVKSEGHYQLLKEAVEKETNVTVVGYFRPDSELTIQDRHLGLKTALEQGLTDLYDNLGQAASETLDLDAIEQIARSSPQLSGVRVGFSGHAPERSGKKIKIGIAYDPAFCFYYPDNLELLQKGGGELILFSPMSNPSLPEVDLLYLGGGYPELYAEALERNVQMREMIRAFAERGGPIYAECGGLMYLTKRLEDFGGREYDMAGVFPAKTVCRPNTMTLGYREITVTEACLLGEVGTRVRGHEFHHSTLVPQGELRYVGSAKDAQGRECGQDGLTHANVLALYTHLHFLPHPGIAWNLVQTAREYSSPAPNEKFG
ncbi:MAG: cobyrinate a,c-diamide synthase [Nitrospirota bacterium]|nr:MAG: cobyrinate a,c-diamide synthase [Nitrospirota bacterium]